MRSTLIILATAATAAGLASGPASAAPAGRTICVQRHRNGCTDQLKDALDAARDGDTVRVGPGTYAGGVVIDKSITLRGAGAGATRIEGGGPVIEIGLGSGAADPTVVISGVTIRGGKVTSTVFDGEVTDWAAHGGGVLIDGRPDGLGGALTIDASVIEDNVAIPSGTTDSPTGKQCPDGRPCPYAQGAGAGISNGGTLTVTRSIVRGNVAGSIPGEPSVASDAQGAGIMSFGPLTVEDSSIVGNASHVRPPLGRFGEGAGIFSFSGGLTLRHSTVARNRAVLESAWPASVEEQAVGGGIFVDGDFTADPDHFAVIEDSRITGNEVSATNTTGNATAFAAGVQGVGQVTVSDSTVAGNRATAAVQAGSDATADADSVGLGLNVGAVLARTRLTGNTAAATAPDGTAFAAGGGLWAWADDPIELRDSLVSGNRASADGRTATAEGAGVVNTDALTMTGATVARNVLRASGSAGAARGAGIFNGRTEASADFTPRLDLTDVGISDNAIGADAGIAVSGGGLFTSEPFARTRVAFDHNRPDDCAGC